MTGIDDLCGQQETDTGNVPPVEKSREAFKV